MCILTHIFGLCIVRKFHQDSDYCEAECVCYVQHLIGCISRPLSSISVATVVT